MIKLVYRNDVGKLEIPQEVLPANGLPHKHHFLSTDADNLIELAGRVCYDSAASEKTRATPEYHQHINDVNHGSVQEHLNFTVEFPIGINRERILASLINRPGIFTDLDEFGYIDVTANIRTINDWGKFKDPDEDGYVCRTLYHFAKELAPLAIINREWSDNTTNGKLVKPRLAEEIWFSFYISGVSRGLTHELVRHKYHTAVSQRSTRYVDESESDWALHPLIMDNWAGINSDKCLGFTKYAATSSFIDRSQDYYDKIVKYLESVLIAKGIDKFTARKQARGAARGILGNALSTELIWSASLDEIKRVISQRANEHADGEIRLWANQLYEIVQPLYPDYFAADTKPCPDGIGFGVYFK